MKRNWKDATDECYYYYKEDDGRIIGQVNKIAFTKVFIARIIRNHNDEVFVGQFISCEFAQQAVRQYWETQDRTFIE